MKKLYLALAAALTAVCANAQSLHFYVHGNEVASGDRIDLTQYLEVDEWGGVMYNPELDVMVDATGQAKMAVTLAKAVSIPEYDWTVGAQIMAQCCAFDGQCVPIQPGQTINKTANLKADQKESTQIEVSLMLGDDQKLETLGLEIECNITATYDGEDYTLTLYVDKTAGVESITADANAQAEYFDLQGRRVMNPEKGLYIVRQGDKVTKVIK